MFLLKYRREVIIKIGLWNKRRLVLFHKRTAHTPWKSLFTKIQDHPASSRLLLLRLLLLLPLGVLGGLLGRLVLLDELLNLSVS